LNPGHPGYEDFGPGLLLFRNNLDLLAFDVRGGLIFAWSLYTEQSWDKLVLWVGRSWLAECPTVPLDCEFWK